MAKKKTAISPTREEDYPEWYQQVVRFGELAEHSPVRGCMVIKPWGYGIWENIKGLLDQKFKETGHKNAYFPLFIPLSFLEKEAEHIDGFAKECAVVTHHRLEKGEDGKLVPAGELEEPLVVRPTSEMIIGEMFAKWISSYRDLPLLLNQWSNVVRWEMRTRLFLRTAEILWQEGHTAHETEKEAREETLKMLDVYADFCHNELAIPVIKGEKTESERFPGAVETYTIEAMMQDGKALQGGTSHFLGQKFAKAADITFSNREGVLEHAWTSSWGVTTRLIGALVMTHGDDNGIVIPPRVAPTHVVLLPIVHKEEVKQEVITCCHEIAATLREQSYAGKSIEVEVDTREMRGGEKSWGWVKKGIPLRIAIGPRDIAEKKVGIARRDQEGESLTPSTFEELPTLIPQMLEEIQNALYQKALLLYQKNSQKIDSKEELYAFFLEKEGGFAYCHWNGKPSFEDILKRDLNVTIRCIPLDGEVEEGACVLTGEKSTKRVILAKAY